MSGEITAQALGGFIRGYRFRFQSEADLQSGIETILRNSNVRFEREVVLSKSDRIDFLVGSVGVEVKKKARRSSLIRQLYRYARSGHLLEILVVIPAPVSLPEEIEGVPIVQVNLLESLL